MILFSYKLVFGSVREDRAVFSTSKAPSPVLFSEIPSVPCKSLSADENKNTLKDTYLHLRVISLTNKTASFLQFVYYFCIGTRHFFVKRTID